MKLELRKIENGYICSIDGKETFHDVPEAICGQLAEWALQRCKELDKGPTYGDAAKVAMSQQLAQALAQVAAMEKHSPGFIDKSHFDDAFKYMSEPPKMVDRVGFKMPLSFSDLKKTVLGGE